MFYNPRTFTEIEARALRVGDMCGTALLTVIQIHYSGPVDRSGKHRIFFDSGEMILVSGDTLMSVTRD